MEEAVAQSPDEYAKARIAKLQRIVDEAGASSARNATETESELVRKAVEVMSSNIKDPLTIVQIANACHASPTMLKQTFKSVVGVPVYQWYRAHRINRSCQLLLESDLTVAQIAYGVGYANASKFSKAFREETGMSPSEYRSRNNPSN